MKKNKKIKMWKSKYRMLFILSLLSWLITTIGDMVDMIISGYYIGNNAVSAVEIIAPISNLLLFISSFIFIGISTLFARKKGEFKDTEAHEIAGTGLIASIIIGFVLMTFTIIFKNSFLELYSTGTLIDSLAYDYYKCYIIIAFIYPIYWLIYYLVMIDSDIKNVFLADIVNVFGNLFFSIILVKKYGIRGIGYGTIIGMILSGIILLVHFAKKNNTIKFSLKIRFKSLFNSFKISSSTALVSFYIAITDIIMNKLVLLKFGEQYLSVYGVINLVLNLSLCLVCGVSAASPFVCVNYGEKNYSLAVQIMKTTTKYTFFLSSIFVIIIEFIASIIPSLFNITDFKLVSDTIFAVRVLGFSYFISGFLSEIIAYYSKIEQELLSNLLGAIHMFLGPIVIVIPMSIIFGFKGMVYAFFIIPIITILIGYCIIKIKYGNNSFPYIIQKNNINIKLIDFDIKNGEIDDLVKQIIIFLKDNKINKKLYNSIGKSIHNFIIQIKEKNNNKNNLLVDCTIIIEDNVIKIILRDNGKIEEFVYFDKKVNHFYSVTTGYNRNCFTWEMN